jgi:assimilatory nitrate reductase catalytic subunit
MRRAYVEEKVRSMTEFHSELEGEAKSSLATQCPFCSVQCKMQVVEKREAERKEFEAVGVLNPASEGRLCIKGMNAYQHVFHLDRILSPLKKVNEQWVHIDWPEALALIAEKFTSLQQAYGRDTLGVYGGGSLTNESAYLLGKFARVALGSKYIDYNGRFCMSAAAAAGIQALGIDRGLTNQLEEIPLTGCIVLVGTNVAECQPTLMPYFTQAKDNGAFIIAIDPRETATTKLADLHLKLKPGTDNALVNGLLKVIFEEGYMDQAFVTARTKGIAELMEHIDAIRLEDVAAITGVALEQIRQAARAYGRTERGMVFTARGVEQQVDGYKAVRNLLNLVLVTGKIGKPGSGYGAITGQGNGQGGREHGQKADQLPGYRSIENPWHRRYIADVWGVEEKELPGKGVSAYEMMEKVHQKEIKGLFIMGSNPVISNPHANFVAKGLKKLDFLVVVDMFMTETAKMADLLLPSSSFLENEGTLTNLEGRVTLRRACLPCPGKVQQDWQILGAIAGVLGKGSLFPYSSAEEIFEELRIASRGGMADYYGITYERIEREHGVYWPCPAPDTPGQARLFAESFPHPDGKANLLPVENQVAKESPSVDYPLYLTTGRVMTHYLTGVQTRRSHTLAARNVESYVEIHPKTARKFGIEDATLVKVESKRGHVLLRCRVTADIREDTLFVPMHWGDWQNINKLTNPALDPTCKMPGFKVSAVKVSPLVPHSFSL